MLDQSVSDPAAQTLLTIISNDLDLKFVWPWLAKEPKIVSSLRFGPWIQFEFNGNESMSDVEQAIRFTNAVLEVLYENYGGRICLRRQIFDDGHSGLQNLFDREEHLIEAIHCAASALKKTRSLPDMGHKEIAEVRKSLERSVTQFVS